MVYSYSRSIRCHRDKPPLAGATILFSREFAAPGPHSVMSDVTQILDRVQQGDPKAAEELLPLVYEELRKLAAARMAQEQGGQTLQPTALVHEAWLRLTGGE